MPRLDLGLAVADTAALRTIGVALGTVTAAVVLLALISVVAGPIPN